MGTLAICGGLLSFWELLAFSCSPWRERARSRGGVPVRQSENEDAAAPPAKSGHGSAAAGYIKKHWRGELSLPVSFWLNSLLANVVAFSLVAVINAAIQDSLNPVLILLALVSMYALLLTITVWQITGTWRSAEKHKKRTGRGGLAVAAQIVIILAVSQLVRPFADGSQQIIETAKIAAETDDGSKFDVRLKNDTDLHITGHIAFRLVGALDEYFDENHAIKSVHLNSLGGRLGPALHISDLILSKELDTYAEGGCYSACTIVFIGGKRRVITIGTKLGFHSGAMPGVSDAEMRSIQSEERHYFLAQGVPPSFLRKAYGTPSDQMWYPTYRDLMTANVVTHIKVGRKLVPIRQYCRTEDCGKFSTAPVWLQEIAAGVNLTVPRKIDPVTIFDRAISGPKKNFTYVYTMQSKQPINFDRVGRNIGKSSCNNKNMDVLIRNGITLHWKYRGPEGGLLHEVTLTPDDCKSYRRSSR